MNWRHTLTLAAFLWMVGLSSGSVAAEFASWTVVPRVLMITAHPDDETLFNIGRFKERGWPVTVVLVTNGEGGSVVQGIKPDYDPTRDEDVLIEKAPGAGVWLTQPPSGPRLRPIDSRRQLARERRREFLAGMRQQRVSAVYFLSGIARVDYEDSWDNGIRNWDVARLERALRQIARRTRPDVVITMNPDESWAHRQHQGLGRLVEQLHSNGGFDRIGKPRPWLFGLREHDWYPESQTPQFGDEHFDRQTWSSILNARYTDDWRRVTSTYLSQSSHPIWLEARAAVGLLPGYGSLDVIRQLNCGDCEDGLTQMFQRYPPSSRRMQALPRWPRVHHLGG